MNRLAAAVIILALSITASIGCYLAAVNGAKEVLAVLEEERDAIVSNANFVSGGSKRIDSEWKKKETLMVSILPHDELEEIELGIMNLPDYENQNMPEEYIKTLNGCISRLEHILETEKPSLKNIF